MLTSNRRMSYETDNHFTDERYARVSGGKTTPVQNKPHSYIKHAPHTAIRTSIQRHTNSVTTKKLDTTINTQNIYKRI